jgi:hypothetical protein
MTVPYVPLKRSPSPRAVRSPLRTLPPTVSTSSTSSPIVPDMARKDVTRSPISSPRSKSTLCEKSPSAIEPATWATLSTGRAMPFAMRIANSAMRTVATSEMIRMNSCSARTGASTSARSISERSAQVTPSCTSSGW